MKSKYWIAFFVKTFTAWAGTQGEKIHHFDHLMIKTISNKLPRFESSCLTQWKYGHIATFKCNKFECDTLGGLIKF